MARLQLFAMLGLCACGGADAGDPCSEPPSGDAIIMVSDADSTLHDVHDGDTVPLIRPVQGGQIVLVGVRVHSSKTCSYHAVGSVQEGTTSALLGVDMRMLALNPRADGWVVPDPGFITLLNVPACPSGNATARIDGTPQTLAVDLTDDATGFPTHLSALVIPTCSDAGCMMDCQKL